MKIDLGTVEIPDSDYKLLRKQGMTKKTIVQYIIEEGTAQLICKMDDQDEYDRGILPSQREERRT